MQKRLKGLNTSICEQTFSWFKNYGAMANEMRANRHKFLMLHFAVKHNEALEFGQAVYLRPHAKKRSQPYACKRPALK